MSKTEINVGVLIARTPSVDLERMEEFARRVVRDTQPELEDATGARWAFHLEDPIRIADDESRRPSDFLDEASLRMVEGPYDLVLVITDVGVVSRRHQVVAGLASAVSHVAVVSTRKLLIAPRGKPVRALDSEAVRWNAAALALHLIGHLLGLEHGEGAMAPFRFEEGRREAPRFGAGQRRRLQRRAAGLPEREHVGGGFFSTFGFHLTSAFRHPGQVFTPLVRNRAPLLPLSLPSLVTAAVAPTFILVFTAEIWDVGLNMPERVIWIFAALSILVSTWYLTGVQNLFFPHKEKRVVTEHMAVVNVTILLTVLLALVGLFLMVALLMLFVETYIFPPDLITSWPTLQDPVVTLLDKFLLASFISTVGVLTGALAGGLESRTLIRHLALFEDEP
jgi:predicted Zn-dependent protease